MHLNDAIQLVKTLFTPINLIGQPHFPQLIADSCSLLRGHSANAAMSSRPRHMSVFPACASTIVVRPVLARLTLTTLGRVVITPDREAGNPCACTSGVAGRGDDEHSSLLVLA